ncbi:triple tyrosine motif-containing protein [Flagellimonas iocasae]|uniref:Triple tyrosine motif-containing protein n=1 Tax=Flagellimonas iocasae TaxID=2055905 RepID=A0ABW4XU94_9FLAO
MRLSILFFLVGFSANLCAQELPPIQNYTPKEYNGEYQNWGISQSNSRNIYVANHTSLLEFDGNKWHSFKLPTSSIIRSVIVVDDKIYTGSYREFGFWSKDETGQLLYTSLSERLDKPLSEDEEFWDILALDHWVLFQSLDRIYIYDQLEDSFKIIEANSAKANLNLVKDKVYFQKDREGLFTIENGEPILVNDATVLTNTSIIGIYDVENYLLIVTEDARFYQYNFESLTPWPTDLDSLNITLYSSIRLKDGSFVLGSISNGFYHLTSDGRLLRNINQAKGLNNNTVLSLFEDVDHNLWLGLDNGISVVNLYSPFNEYVDKLGNIGLVYAALNHDGYLYLGTNQGLFFRKEEGAEEFRMIPGTEGQVWNLQLVDSTVFCGHNRGTFVVEGSRAQQISDFPGTWGVKPMPTTPNLILQGNYNGLSVLEKNAGSWKLRNTIENFSISSRFFEIVDSLEIVVNHEQKGLYHIFLDPNLKRAEKVINEEPVGHSSNIFKFKNRLYYKTYDGIYTIENELDNISLDSTLTKMVFVENENPISIVIPDTIQERLWFFTENGIKYITQSTLSGKLSVNYVPMSSTLRSNLGVSGFENISRISENKYLIGSSNGYVTLDLDNVTPIENTIKINHVFYGDYPNLSTRIPTQSIGEFSYTNNNVKFEYSVPEFDKYTEVKYQYKLEGIYDEWSEWDEIPETTFNNLSFGEYTFRVRAMVGNSATENTASYQFSIARPWYWSISAIIAYILALCLIFFLIHRLYKRYYRKKQETLILKNQKELERRELQEKERIAQILNDKLQDEIENKNRELAISTMSILKKNKFLSQLKSQLNTVTDKGKSIKTVIKEIDRNINSEDDWKFFEDAFNNADKDFLKRIKSKHEDLTNNDLRLCAYLRLNLSSKEIAPLLNISVKSVEMKRYRLRKKFNLPHQDNLTDYILNF